MAAENNSPETPAVNPTPVTQPGEPEGPIRLDIDRVILAAHNVVERIDRDLPGHPGLMRAARGVEQAARDAKRVSQWLKARWGLNRLPALFLAVSLVLFIGWVYWNFFHVSSLRVAVPDRDAVRLHSRLASGQRLQFVEVLTKGSQDCADRVARGDVDLAFVQGGVSFRQDLPRRETPNPELVLLFLRNGIAGPGDIHTILTSIEGQGSHSVAQDFVRLWNTEGKVTYLHEWTELSGKEPYKIPAQVDAVFAVKDPREEKAVVAAERLAAAGFRIASPDLGARALLLDYLRPASIARGYYRMSPPVPEEEIPTYSVVTYLVAREGLTPRLMAAASHLLDATSNPFAEEGVELTFHDTSDMLQGLDSFLSVLVYIGLAFLALLGLETMTYRRRFDELNTLVSLLSMHQSARDVLGVKDPSLLAENLGYLRMCSDLLGLIGVITGYYTQENSSLLYNTLMETIQERCSGLKVNIQLKILHAAVQWQPVGQLAMLPNGQPSPTVVEAAPPPT